MAGYGYGHSEPGQPLPTAQEVVAGTDGRDMYHQQQQQQHNIAHNTTWPFQQKDSGYVSLFYTLLILYLSLTYTHNLFTYFCLCVGW